MSAAALYSYRFRLWALSTLLGLFCNTAPSFFCIAFDACRRHVESVGAAGDRRRNLLGARAQYMAAGTTLKLGVRHGRRPVLAGVSSFYPQVARGSLNMPFNQKISSSPVQIAEPAPSPFGDELDQSHRLPPKSPPPSGLVHRRRRSTKGAMPAIIKRSSSTPNVRGLASSDTAASLAEKRRNKLGYHRTSVACGESSV